MTPEYLEVDPRVLHLPPARSTGADPFKLQRQIAQFGISTAGMPPPFVYRGSDDRLMIFDGVMRSTRVARLLPGTRIRVEVVGELPFPFRNLPTVGDRFVMNANARSEPLHVLGDLSARFPEVRLGQLITNLSYAVKGPTHQAVWDVEDEELLTAAKECLRRNGQSKSSVA